MMVFAWLIGLVLPACAASGADGMSVPPPMDLTRIERPTTPNTALAAPASTTPLATPAPDIVTPVYNVPPARLFAAINAVAAAQKRTYLAASYPGQLQAHYVARSAVFNFPDLIAVQVTPSGADATADRSTLVLYSRSVYGHSDLGVNRQRLLEWLAALDVSLLPQPQR